MYWNTSSIFTPKAETILKASKRDGASFPASRAMIVGGSHPPAEQAVPGLFRHCESDVPESVSLYRSNTFCSRRLPAIAAALEFQGVSTTKATIKEQQEGADAWQRVSKFSLK